MSIPFDILLYSTIIMTQVLSVCQYHLIIAFYYTKYKRFSNFLELFILYIRLGRKKSMQFKFKFLYLFLI